MNTLHGPLPDRSASRPPARRGATPWRYRVAVVSMGLLWAAEVQGQGKVPDSARPTVGSPATATDAASSRPAAPVDPALPAATSPTAVSPAPSPDQPGSASARRLLLVRASPVPLGENSVLAVGADQAKDELKGLEGGMLRRSLSEPRVLSVPEQGGWVRGFFKEPKASRLWSFFNPRAPVDSETDLQRSARIFGIRGDAPLPTSQVDPVHVEPVGIRFWQISR